MDLALRGRVRLDLSTAATPLARARGGVGTATIASFVLGLGLSFALAFTGHPGAAMPVGAGAMVCFGGLILLGNRARDRGRGYLRVVDRSPTGDAALDELLVLMIRGRARSAQRWLLVRRLSVDQRGPKSPVQPLPGWLADYDVASALGADLYGTLLGIRQGVMDAIESLRPR